MFADERDRTGQAVLIVAQSTAFAQALMDHWQRSSASPSFTVLVHGEHTGQSAAHHNAYHLVIIEGAALMPNRSMLQRLYAVGTPMICALPASPADRRGGTSEPIVMSPTAQQLRADFPRLITLNLADSDSGLEIVATVAAEVLKRIEVTLRLKKVESESGAQSAQMALGKYVAESMHGFNNALTAVIGNAELLMLDSASLSPEMQEEIEAVHSNALRLHEIMQRFSSLDAEIEAGRKQGKSAAAGTSQAYLSGT